MHSIVGSSTSEFRHIHSVGKLFKRIDNESTQLMLQHWYICIPTQLYMYIATVKQIYIYMYNYTCKLLKLFTAVAIQHNVRRFHKQLSPGATNSLEHTFWTWLSIFGHCTQMLLAQYRTPHYLYREQHMYMYMYRYVHVHIIHVRIKLMAYSTK